MIRSKGLVNSCPMSAGGGTRVGDSCTFEDTKQYQFFYDYV